MKNKGGRPPKIEGLVLKKLEEAFLDGCTDEEACFYAGISPAALYEYQKKTPEFLERKQALKNRPVLEARRAVIKGLKKDPDLALKYLERKKKDEFSPRQEISAEPCPHCRVLERYEKMTPEEIDKEIREKIEFLKSTLENSDT